jgi:flagellum-specific peptidoglycan hydrolase FlgJ
MEFKPLKLLLLKLLVALPLLLISLAGTSQKIYIKKYRPLADSLGAEYGIPASLILGVALLESASGTSANCKLLNNHFGMEGKNSAFKRKKIKTRYKEYKSARDSYIDFCKLLSHRKYYKKLKGNLNFHLWVDAISKSGYSEVPSIWKERVTSTILKNHLQK